jgi:hypothetical protein
VLIRKVFSASLVAGVLALTVPLVAQKPANAPANTTAQCQDGTYSTAKTERGACSKHGGVKTWWGPAVGGKSSPAGGSSKSKEAPSTKSATEGAPAGATGECNDGTFTRAKTQQGACSRHGGVKTWYGAGSTAVTPPPPPPPPASSGTPPTPPAAKEPSGKAPTKSAAGAPENATAKCKDGTYSFAKQHRGACSHHGGVAEWYK